VTDVIRAKWYDKKKICVHVWATERQANRQAQRQAERIVPAHEALAPDQAPDCQQFRPQIRLVEPPFGSEVDEGQHEGDTHHTTEHTVGVLPEIDELEILNADTVVDLH
jgi:hypothetical protein